MLAELTCEDVSANRGILHVHRQPERTRLADSVVLLSVDWSIDFPAGHEKSHELLTHLRIYA